LELALIADDVRDGHPVIRVTLRISDRFMAVGCITGPSLVLLLYLEGGMGFGRYEILLVVFLLACSLFGVSILSTWVTIGRSFVEEHGIRGKAKRIELPDRVVVDRCGPLVCLRDESGEFEYRFSKYLNHGTKLEERLREFFKAEAEDLQGERAGRRL
jgi:hypothetical protein